MNRDNVNIIEEELSRLCGLTIRLLEAQELLQTRMNQVHDEGPVMMRLREMSLELDELINLIQQEIRIIFCLVMLPKRTPKRG